jgi:hypothetical protein
MYAAAFALAYHGCDEEVGEKILRNKEHVSRSENQHDWLGHGAYFWENSPARALQWVEFVKHNPQHFRHKIQKTFIVGAVIDLGNCLDLTDAGSLEIVSSGYDQPKAASEQARIPLPRNAQSYERDVDMVKRNLDCAVINFVHVIRERQKLSAFDTVRGIFTEGKELYPGAMIMSKTPSQICVRNPEVSVKAYFRPISNQD